jgi:hypothetical protein
MVPNCWILALVQYLMATTEYAGRGSRAVWGMNSFDRSEAVIAWMFNV